MTNTVSRRFVAKGAAWSIPAVSIAAAAPALASSTDTPPASTFHGYVNYNREIGTVEADGSTNFKWYSVGSPGQVAYGGPSVEIANTKVGDVVSNVSQTLYLPDGNLGWSRSTGGACWSQPQKTGATQKFDGVTYYGYKTTYTCPITATDGTTLIATPFAFQSTSQVNNTYLFGISTTMTVDRPSTGENFVLDWTPGTALPINANG